MYESLTRYLSDLEQAENYGEWVVDRESKGTHDDPVHASWMVYTPLVQSFIDAIYDFQDAHPDYELMSYRWILEDRGIDWTRDVSDAEVSQLDGQAVLALLMGAAQTGRFGEGSILFFLKEGYMQRWLRRLQELDGEG